MCVYYGGIKLSSNAPVEVALCVTCNTDHRVVVIYNLDEMRVNGRCPSFWGCFFFSLMSIAHVKENSVGSYSAFLEL